MVTLPSTSSNMYGLPYRAQIPALSTGFVKNYREAETVYFENLPKHSNMLIHKTFLSCSNSPLGQQIVAVKFL
jgi:hypothetical protein